MSNIISRAFAGDTTDVWAVGFVTSEIGADPVVLADLTPFTCKIAVLNAVPAINRSVTSVNTANNRFQAWLTPAETLALGVGDWQVGIQLSNPALIPALVKEVQVSLKILAGLVP